MQSNPSAMPVAIYSVLCLLHMVEQLINSLTDPLKGWFPGTRFILSPFTAVICVSHCLRVCVSCLSQSTVAGCPIVCQLPVPPCHQSITPSTPAFCPTAYSAVYPCQLSVLPSLSVISLFLLPPVSVISLFLLPPVSVISLFLLPPVSVISPSASAV